MPTQRIIPSVEEQRIVPQSGTYFAPIAPNGANFYEATLTRNSFQ